MAHFSIISSKVQSILYFRLKISVNSGSSYESIVSSLILSIFPNPAYNEITIETGEMDENADVFVTDLSGKEILKSQIDKGSTITNLNFSQLEEGCYFISISIGGRNITRTIVKI